MKRNDPITNRVVPNVRYSERSGRNKMLPTRKIVFAKRKTRALPKITGSQSGIDNTAWVVEILQMM